MCSALTGNRLILCSLLEEIWGREMTANQCMVYSTADERRSAYGTHVELYTLRLCLRVGQCNILLAFKELEQTFQLWAFLFFSFSLPMSAEECLCQNGGVCVDINGTCDCPSGYTGLYCQFGEYDTYNPIRCPAWAWINVEKKETVGRRKITNAYTVANPPPITMPFSQK